MAGHSDFARRRLWGARHILFRFCYLSDMENSILFGFYDLAKNIGGEGVAAAPVAALPGWREAAESATCAA